MEKYIFTSEEGIHYISETITDEDVQAWEDGLISIIRLSDGHQFNGEFDWVELPVWGDW